MWYHAIAYYGSRYRYWWNRSRDDLIKDVIVPYASKQLVVLSRDSIPSIFNFGATDYITIVKTTSPLSKSGGKYPTELTDKAYLKKNCATKDFLAEMQTLQSTPETKSLLEQAITPSQKQIFVIMQFGDEFLDSAYGGVIKPLGNSFGFDVVRVDEIQDSGNITQQILEGISSSAIVIADLTGERPNCYYEAGFAHAIGKELVLAAQEGPKIHFDLAGNRIIRWRTEKDYREQLRQRIESITAKGGA